LSYILFHEIPSKKNWVAVILSFCSVLVLLEVWHIKHLDQFYKGTPLTSPCLKAGVLRGGGDNSMGSFGNYRDYDFYFVGVISAILYSRSLEL